MFERVSKGHSTASPVKLQFWSVSRPDAALSFAQTVSSLLHPDFAYFQPPPPSFAKPDITRQNQTVSHNQTASHNETGQHQTRQAQSVSHNPTSSHDQTRKHQEIVSFYSTIKELRAADNNNLSNPEEFDIGNCWDFQLDSTEGIFHNLRISGTPCSQTLKKLVEMSNIVGISLVLETHPFRFQAIKSTHNAVERYQSKLQMALKILPCDAAIVLLKTELGATVVIHGSDKTCIWKRELANLFKLPLLISGTCENLFESHLSRGEFGGKQYKITPGISIGREGFAKVGTLCAIFTSGNRLYGITAAHVLHSPDTIVEQLRQNGEFIDKTEFSIMHPSETDVLIEDFCLKEAYEKVHGMVRGGVLSKKEGAIQASEIQTLIASNRAHELGKHVFSYLGYGDNINEDSTATVCRLDFSVFTLNDTTATNSLPPTLLKLRKGKITANIRGVVPDTTVYKIGRTSGQSVGIISGLGESRNTKYLQFPTTEFLAMGESKLFALWGDSGSGVWDEFGNLVGMVWGSSPGTNTNYVTSLPLILDRLEYHQNLKLELKPNELDDVWCGREEDYKLLGSDVVDSLKVMVHSDNIDVY